MTTGNITRILLMAAISSMPIVLTGCGTAEDVSGATVVVTPVAEGPHLLLLSEVLAAEDRRAVIPSEFIVENLSDQSQTLVLAAKSCSCYGVMVDGELVEVDESFTIGPHTSRNFRMTVTAPIAASEKTWRLKFRIDGADKSPAEIPVALTARVIDDARMEPDVVTIGATSASSDGSRRVPLRIRHTWRGNATSVAPQVTGLPETCPVTIVNPDAVSEELEPGLWQQTWELTVEIPQGELTDTGLHRIEAVFAGADGKKATAHGRLLVESRRGIVAPEVVHLGPVPIGDVRRRRIILAADDGRAFRMTGWANEAEDFSPNLIVEFDDAQTDLRHLVEIEWTAKNAGATTQRLVLTTDHPQCPRVTIDVQATGIAAADDS